MSQITRLTDKQTDRRTDRQTEFSSLDRVCISCSAVKINGAYYRDVLLGQQLLPAIRSVAGDFFTYNAPAHRADDTVEFLSRNTPDFISPLPWPPNSPELNPVDYEVWGVLQQRVYHSRIRDVDHLREREREFIDQVTHNHTMYTVKYSGWLPE